MPTYEIEDVKRLNVGPGDVLLVTVPEETTPEKAQAIGSLFETNLPVRVIVKLAGIEVEVVHEDDAQ